MDYKNFAKIYDRFMSHCNYDEWTDYVKSKIIEYNPHGKNLLEVGCGTGEIILRLKNLFKCSGLDLSEDMLKIAHKKLKNMNIPLFLGDMREFDTGEKYDIVVALFDTVNHLTSLEDLEDFFDSISKNLNPNGILIFDVVDRKFMDEMFPNSIYYDNREDMTIIWELFREDDLDIIEATYFIKSKTGYFEKLEEVYEKRLFSEYEIRTKIEKNKLNLLCIDKSVKIAGERDFYIVKKM